MKKYFFLLGSTPELSLAELQAVFGADNVVRFSHQGAIVQMDQEPAAVINRLGGTVKIGEILQTFAKNISETDLQNFLTDYFLNLHQNKIHFAIGEIGRDQKESFDVVKLKKNLQELGLKVRFNDQSRQGVGAALLLHRHDLIEILLTSGDDDHRQELLASRTLAVQDIDDWTKRDRGKPYADHKKGMLPPKLARMMVNLALGAAEFTSEKSLYDPFCGTGTILLEAASTSNLRLIGTDLDVKAILGAKENLAWWSEAYGQNVASTFFVSDVTHAEPKSLGAPLDFIVTEPFLGKQTPKSNELMGVFRGLEKLYWGAFRHWTQILRPGAKVVIVMPRVHADNGQIFTLDSLLDKLVSLGYNKQSQELFYARPQAIVEREIAVFEYKPNLKGN